MNKYLALTLLAGMAAASFTIIWMKIKLETHSLLFCSLGAVGGMVFGRQVLVLGVH